MKCNDTAILMFSILFVMTELRNNLDRERIEGNKIFFLFQTDFDAQMKCYGIWNGKFCGFIYLNN